jgi:hypothetical protein
MSWLNRYSLMKLLDITVLGIPNANEVTGLCNKIGRMIYG